MPKSRPPQSDQELNLAPIMNMVVILIPLLLLSVVFISAAVINVSAPSLSPGPASEAEPSDNPMVTLAVGARGLVVTSKDGELARVEIEDRKALSAALEELEAARRSGDRPAEERALTKLRSQYGWASLYAEMVRVKRTYPETSTVRLSAEGDLPYALIVSAMDAVRFRLPSESFGSNREFWAANIAANGSASAEPLFAAPVLAVAR